MISTLLKKIMQKFGLKQAELAEVMEVKLQRVRDLASGRAEKLTREESELLVEKLEIRAEWLITGDGEMLQDSEPQDELVDRMRAINQAHVMIDALPLGELEKSRLKAIMTGDAKIDGEAIAAEMAKSLSQRYPNGETTFLNAREAALINNYRAAPEDGKQALETTGAALAQSMSQVKKRGEAA